MKCLHSAIDEIGNAVTYIIAEKAKKNASENAIEGIINILQELQTRIDNQAYNFSEEIKATEDVIPLLEIQPKGRHQKQVY